MKRKTHQDRLVFIFADDSVVNDAIKRTEKDGSVGKEKSRS